MEIVSSLVFNRRLTPRALGHYELVCTFTIGINRSCNGTIFLPKGKLVVAGVLRYRQFYELSVTGGTGLYNNARGTMTVTDRRQPAPAACSSSASSDESKGKPCFPRYCWLGFSGRQAALRRRGRACPRRAVLFRARAADGGRRRTWAAPRSAAHRSSSARNAGKFYEFLITGQVNYRGRWWGDGARVGPAGPRSWASQSARRSWPARTSRGARVGDAAVQAERAPDRDGRPDGRVAPRDDERPAPADGAGHELREQLRRLRPLLPLARPR